MSNPKKPVQKRGCDSCKQAHWHNVSGPCDACKGLLCGKCCGIKRLLAKRAEEEFVASRLAAGLPLYDETLVDWNEPASGYPVPRTWKGALDEYRKREAEAMLDLDCAIARLAKDGE